MQAQVPSNIDIEDKIVGPFTLKQFIYLAIGGMLIVVDYAFFKTSMIFVIIAFIVIAFDVLFVFYRFNEQPFEKILYSFLIFYLSPKRRLWQRKAGLADIQISKGPKDKREDLVQKKTKKNISSLDELSYVLDSRGWVESNKK